MDENKLRKANSLQEKIRRLENQRKDLEEDLFLTRDLDELLDESICSHNCNQEFRYKRQRIFIPKSLIEERLNISLLSLNKKITDAKKEFKEL